MGDVLKIRDEYRQVQWAAAIQECKASGLSNKEYCIQHGLSDSRPRFPPYIVAGLRELTCSYKLRSVSVRRHSRQKKPRRLARLFCLCWHYLSSRQVTLQVLSAQMSLTSVFGMGTGGPSSQSIPTCVDGVEPSFMSKPSLGSNGFVLFFSLLGDPYRIRTDVKGVRGLCLNHLTNGPLVHLHGLEPGTH